MADGLFSDEMLAIYVPTLVFWIASWTYELIACLRPDLRLHTIEEEKQKNIPSRWRVTMFVLLHQAAQTLCLVLFLKAITPLPSLEITGNDKGGIPVAQPPLPMAALQFFAAMVILDTIYYFSHRYVHSNRLLYSRVHFVHHAVVVPHAAGALYGHPFDGVLLDVLVGPLSCALTGMTARTAMCFFSFVNVKIADLHSGLWLPWSPLIVLFGNNSAFHDTHHQLKGARCNFSQPFFLFWDQILGTFVPFTVEKRSRGYEARLIIKDYSQ